VSTLQHAARIGLLMGGAAALLGWVLRHSEATSHDGLRYIHEAEQIDRGAWRDGLVQGIDHPLQPLGIVAAHRLIGGTGPASWQRAALVLCFASMVLLVIPSYLLARELFDDRTAWLACVLVLVNPIMGSIVVNVLSESTFVLWWTFGLWGAARFLREGRFLWLPIALGCGALAYLTRPEGMLLPAAVLLTLLLLPMLRITRINWPRWWRALAFLAAGLVLLVGPYVAVKGGLGTKPAIARVLGLAPRSGPLDLEREEPLAADQSPVETYRAATVRMLEVVAAAVTPPLFPLAILGLALAGLRTARIRAWLFLGIVLAGSAVGLVRLHATGGYCSVRHGLVPGLILTMAAAHGLSWVMSRIAIPGRWLGLGQDRLRPGPAVWAVLLVLLVVLPNLRTLGPINAGSYSVYHAAGRWIAQHASPAEGILDLTDWSLYFSQRPGARFAEIYDAGGDPNLRWILALPAQVAGHGPYSRVLRDLIAERAPVALIPPDAGTDQVQIRVYDRRTAGAWAASATNADGHPRETRRR
jgi:4-amino-4-deoxy-L-arabinose transferase-like glycosyltransferase